MANGWKASFRGEVGIISCRTRSIGCAVIVTVKISLNLAQRARKLYESSKVEKKRQNLNFLFSKLEM
ncbi:hypothetical protein [Candidatus Protochlamydia sp. R18]|uniref:hypothetical protein n=1 Tax=Candidatus Protochlamydia sp. R18 TaxID=1353977 RepID=UPI0005A6A080|nr:hypothetical protein [Candidatus Protochlamydia sp. R18]